MLTMSRKRKVMILFNVLLRAFISFYIPGNSELGIIILRYILFMRKVKSRGLRDLLFLISESRGRSHRDLPGAPAVRAILSHIAFTCLSCTLPILLQAFFKASFGTLDFGFWILI